MTTPQSKALTSDQVRNRAGGFVFTVDAWTRLDRFLLLGTEGGAYHTTAQELTEENTKNLLVCLGRDGARYLERVVSFREQGRSVRPNACVFALAIALKRGDLPTRRLAAELTPRVCATARQLFLLARYIEALGGGWGRVTRRAFSNWYLGATPERLGYQMLKYRGREGWTHRDLLRKCHPRADTPERERLLGWPNQGWPALDPSPPERHIAQGGPYTQLAGFELLRHAQTVTDVRQLIEAHSLPWEAVPPQWLGDAKTWSALLDRMPMGAMVRNLARMTANGLLTQVSPATEIVAQRLRDAERVRRARLHPMVLLNALRIYAQGHGQRGSLTWTPVPAVQDALHEAFYLSFEHLAPSGARVLLALDVSGSMSCGSCAGLEGLSPREASVAMAMALARSEELYNVVGFAGGLVPLDIGRSTRLERALEVVSGLPFGATDCAQPMLHALREERDYDLFVVLTDNETWCGQVHPVTALRRYRDARVPGAKLMVCACTASAFSIADPKDAGMLDVCGADANLPILMREFVRG